MIVTPGKSFGQDMHHSASCNSRASELLLPLTGDWIVDWIFRNTQGNYDHSTAVAHLEKDSIGCMLTEHFYGTRDGKELAMFSIINFSNSGELQKLYFDTGHGRFLLFKGVQDKDSIQFTWENKMDNKTLISRKLYRHILPDNFEIISYLSQDGGMNWEMVESEKYRRAPKN
jgi:hypothetical protein